MRTVYIFLANGFEEIEATVPMDLLVRAGIAIQRVGVETREIQGNSGTTIITDSIIEEIHPGKDDILFLPGGKEGAENLSKHTKLIEILHAHNKNNGIISAICIAPAWVLGRHGLLNNRKYTCYPGGEQDIHDTSAIWVEKTVVIDKNIITSRGIGTVFEFSTVLISTILNDTHVAKNIWEATLLPMSTKNFPVLD